MSYIKVKNPTEKDVTTGYKGEYITIPSKEAKSLPQEVAERFMEVYGFLELVAEEGTKEEVQEVVEKKAAKK